MSADCLVESNRKLLNSTDYTLSTINDEKNMVSERIQSALPAENEINIRDRSLSTCQQQHIDDDTFEMLRVGTDKKNEINHTTTTDNNNSKRQKTICYDFKKGICRRRFCRVNKE